MAESLIGTHTQELLEAHPELAEVVDRVVSRRSSKAFFAMKDDSGKTRYEQLLEAKFADMLKNPSTITPDMLKFLTEATVSKDDSNGVLNLFRDLNQIPDDVQVVVVKK